MPNFRKLDVWNKSIECVRNRYRYVQLSPAGERFGFITRMQGATVSIPADIAEGFAKPGDKDFCRFLERALVYGFLSTVLFKQTLCTIY
ncbi:MAG TPA: hypothetical protein DEG28_15330 [Porphyromonadaceae bacterium]|nr:hypothetical protein [Porphyromonadaceae bacterium]